MSTSPAASQAELHKNKAVAMRKAGKFDQALVELDQALALQPLYPQAIFNIAAIRMDQDHPDQAADLFRQAIAQKPDYHQAMISLATCLRKLGKLDEAREVCQQAIQIHPNDADAHGTMGTILHALFQMDDAVKEFETALSLRGDDVRILNNFANLLMDIDQPVRASQCYRTAIRIDPNRAELFNNLANMLKLQGEIDEAIACYRRSLALMPDAYGTHSNLLLTLNCHPRSEEGLLPAHQDWAKHHAERFYPADPLQFPNDPAPHRKLRIGYVSPDFRKHSVAYFLAPILATHDHSQFEVYCYSDVLRGDPITARMKSHADHWRDIAGLADERVDQIIREDQIDILIDLAGHTGNNRLLVFARKPAPVQVNYLGYPNTTGLATMDYRLTDIEADPLRTHDGCTEELIRLPCGFLCYQPLEQTPPPRDLSIARQEVTFGSFNNFAKVTEPTLKLWASILDQVPGSKLVLKAESLSDPEVRQALCAAFTGVGGDPARLVPLGRDRSTAVHLANYHRLDIALDTFPYNGTTTTCEALWMGVPVITLAGRAHHSRVGVSLLTRVGLTGLIAKSPEDYVSTAVNLAKETARRHAISQGLRNRMRRSPLMNATSFVKDLEAAYRKMWEDWCSDKRA